MTLIPLITSICLNAGPEYNEACKNALAQAAQQSGIARQFETTTQEFEKTTIRYINPSAAVEFVSSTSFFFGRIAAGQEAAISVKAFENASLSLIASKQIIMLNLGVDF